MTMLHDFLTPEKIKASPPKRKKTERLEITDNFTSDNVSILEISSRAKKRGYDIVSELRKAGIEIQEVTL